MRRLLGVGAAICDSPVWLLSVESEADERLRPVSESVIVAPFVTMITNMSNKPTGETFKVHYPGHYRIH